jgi:hypothetical protein
MAPGAHGVDVLSVVSPAMDTPSLKEVLAKSGVESVPGLFQPDDVVRTALERLPDGPTIVFPFGPEADQADAIEQARGARARKMSEAAKMFFGDKLSP